MSNVMRTLSLPLKGDATQRECSKPPPSGDDENTPLFIYLNEKYRFIVSRVLKRHGIAFVINQYEVDNWKDRTACFFKRSELETFQSDYLVEAASQGACVTSLLQYLEQTLHCVEVDLLHSEYLLEFATTRSPFWYFYQYLRRGVDIFLATALLLMTLPIWLMTAIAIRLESEGNIFFRQRRTGLFNHQFDIIKFRSMVSDAEKSGAKWASKNDARVTKVGRFIRMTRIDELPQLLNVLKGEMSLIGPRPEREVFIETLEQHVPFYRFRHTVKPGITGLAQISYTYGASIDDAMEKHRHDLFYIKHQNVILDLKILWATFLVVVRREGI